MVVYLVALMAALFYAANVPVRIAFTLRLGEQSHLRIGVGLFNARWITHKQIGLFEKKPSKSQSRMPMIRAGLRLIRRANLKDARISLQLGTGDAARTAMLCGAAGTILSSLRLPGRVTPDFNQSQLALSAGGMVYLRAGHIMLAAMHLAREQAKERIIHGQASH